jgi:hypothetical protein
MRKGVVGNAKVMRAPSVVHHGCRALLKEEGKGKGHESRTEVECGAG